MLFYKRNLKRIAIMFVVIFLSVAVNGHTAKAISSTTSVSITGVQQARDQWCWAACAEIIGKTVFSGSTRTQFDVVNLLKRTNENPWPNVAGSPSEEAEGASYVAFYNKYFTSEHETLSFSEITYSLAKGYAVSTPGGYYEAAGYDFVKRNFNDFFLSPCIKIQISKHWSRVKQACFARP